MNIATALLGNQALERLERKLSYHYHDMVITHPDTLRYVEVLESKAWSGKREPWSRICLSGCIPGWEKREEMFAYRAFESDQLP